MHQEASFRVFGRSRLDAVLTATRVGRLLGVGQGNKFKPSDITGGCLALTRNKIKNKTLPLKQIDFLRLCGYAGRDEIGLDTGFEVKAVFGVILLDDVFGGIGLDILEPGNVTLEGLKVFIRPLFALLFIAEVGINGGFEDFIFAVADCDLVILIEHDAKNPVAAGAGVELGFGFIEGERSVHLGEKLDDEALDGVIIEDNFAGNLDIVRVTGIAEAVGDGGSVRVMLARFKMIDGLGEGVVKGDHHDVSDERGDGGALRQCAVKEAEVKGFEQLRVAGGAGEDEVERINKFKLG